MTLTVFLKHLLSLLSNDIFNKIICKLFNQTTMYCKPTLNKGSFERKCSVSYFMLYLRDLFYNCPVGGRLGYNNCIPYRVTKRPSIGLMLVEFCMDNVYL